MNIDLVYIATVLLIILFSMILHEIAHGLVAYKLGDDTAKMQGRLTLNPIKHIDPFLTIALPVYLAIIGAPIFGGAKPVQVNTVRLKGGDAGWALVSIAGPLVNLVLAFIAYGVVLHTTGGVQSTFLLATYINLGFFAFNMLPIPPLDGSRVLYAISPDFLRSALEAVEQYALFIVFAIVLFANSQLGVVLTSIMGAMLSFFRMLYGVQ